MSSSFPFSMCDLIEEERKQLYREGPLPESLLGSLWEWRIELRKSTHWHDVHAVVFFPQNILVQSGFKALSLGYFCNGVPPRGKVSFVSLLNFFTNYPCLDRLPHHLCLPFWECNALNSKPWGWESPNNPQPGEKWRTSSGNMLIRAETHLSISWACHGTDNQGGFYAQDSSSLMSVWRVNILVGKKATLSWS